MERVETGGESPRKKYNPYDPDSVKRYTQKEILAMDENRPEKMMFSVVLEEGDADKDGEKPGLREVTCIDGRCFINGKEVRPAEAGAEVIRCGKHTLLSEEQRKILCINKPSEKQEETN